MTEQEYYRDRIVEMLAKVDSVVFLQQIWIIIKRHIERRGGTV